jgi:hypothetical protein
MRNYRAIVIATLAGMACAPAASSVVAQRADVGVCTFDGPTAAVPGLFEGSGIAASRVTPGRYWTHNDSGAPELFALDAKGAVTGRLRLSGTKVDDWEALASGPCPAGTCLYVGDIGDNDAERNRITVYRFPEPAGTDSPVAAPEALHARYPDGAHDAESLLVGPDGSLYIVTKGDTGPIAIYRFPQPLRAGTTHLLERIGAARRPESERERFTDGAMSPDGTWVALRTTRALTFYRASDVLSGRWQPAAMVDLDAVAEPQGEGVTFASETALALAGEGGGKKRPGTFARLTCNLPAAGS